jgi:Mor family transcriptional regulator
LLTTSRTNDQHIGAFCAPSAVKGLSGHETLHHILVRRAAQSLLTRFYAIPPQSTELELLSRRNEKIRQLYHEGWTISDLSRQFNLSVQRIYQIIKRRNH